MAPKSAATALLNWGIELVVPENGGSQHSRVVVKLHLQDEQVLQGLTIIDSQIVERYSAATMHRALQDAEAAIDEVKSHPRSWIGPLVMPNFRTEPIRFLE